MKLLIIPLCLIMTVVPGDLTAQSSIHNPTQQIPTIPLGTLLILEIMHASFTLIYQL